MTEYCQIELTQGQVARVSPEDFEGLSKFNWHATRVPGAEIYYALRSIRIGKKTTKISMHRQIMGFPEGFHIDHIYGNTLDNRRTRLRLATRSENMRNQSISCRNKSGFKGVGWHKMGQRWQASIKVEKKNIHLGLYDAPEEAHAAYVKAAEKHFGEFARAA